MRNPFTNLTGTLVAFGLLGGLTSCSSAGHDALRGDQPTAADATGRSTIKAVEGASSPLVVDWKPEQRADLEEAIHDGIAIVAWDDKGLRLLKRCKLAGDYGYLPVQMKKDVIRLETADEVQASLPLGGVGIAAKIGGGFDKGATVDIALAMIGKRRTTWNDVKREDLSGNCEGATHYARAILVGAFTMKTGTHAKVEAAAEIFGLGASGGSGSSKDVGSTDGKIDDCDKATGEEAKPPGQCAALLRIELEPISNGPTVAAPVKEEHAAPEVKSEAVEGCPPGYVYAGGACRAAKPNLPHLCTAGDAADCKAQCGLGNAPSCERLGSLLGARDPAGSGAAFEKACSGGYASGCTNLGISLLGGSSKEPEKAAKALLMGCQRGDARGCAIAGELAMNGVGGPKDAARALRFYVKGCDGGDYTACTNAGFLYAGGGGAGVERNDARAVDYGRRACFGGESVACGNIGYKVELGEGVPANPALASALYERACRLSPGQCFRGGFLFETGGSGVSRDDHKAQTLLGISCKAGGGMAQMACVVGASVYGNAGSLDKGALEHNAQRMKTQCEQNEGRACAFLGISEFGLGHKAEAQKALKQSCGFKDVLGCELAKKLR